ncbi:PREDICTED: uncharacterized protein LOC109126343 [Camelina sativa]|uniref:Uncharacterized protein LOC109126343 n=1 Tax=Camelina sativa TaxID=90675 RepID=A0ABM1QF54_CAMSA|nr:PREDICTED: uncharacterized protein LOC109126343 [Camelina sativa]
MDQALYSLETRFEQFQNLCCHCWEKFFKVKVDQVIFAINYVKRKIEWTSYHIHRKRTSWGPRL